MGLTKQAKTISPTMQSATLHYLSGTRHPIRNRLMFLLSVKCGLRAKEIAAVYWSLVIDAEGKLTGELKIPNSVAKGHAGGRTIPLSKVVMEELERHRDSLWHRDGPNDRIIQSERSDRVTPQVIVNTFAKWYRDLGYDGCSSHSGRRTFITNAARNITSVGGSLRDIQDLAGHSSLQTTQLYIEVNKEARSKVVELI